MGWRRFQKEYNTKFISRPVRYYFVADAMKRYPRIITAAKIERSGKPDDDIRNSRMVGKTLPARQKPKLFVTDVQDYIKRDNKCSAWRHSLSLRSPTHRKELSWYSKQTFSSVPATTHQQDLTRNFIKVIALCSTSQWTPFCAIWPPEPRKNFENIRRQFINHRKAMDGYRFV